MPDPQTANKFLYTPAHNADIDTWDVPVNANWNGLDQALGTYTTLNANGLSGTVALTTSQSIPLGFIVTGTPAGNLVYQTPAGVGGIWLVRNQATLGASITLGFNSASGGATVNIPSATNLPISADGTSNGMAKIDTGAPSAAGSNTQIQVNVLGAFGAYAGFTFDGATFHTPQLTVDGNAIFGTGAGSTLTINGTAISAPNGFNFNSGAFRMNAGGMLGIGTAPTAALLTVGGLVTVTAGGVKYPDGNTQTIAYPGTTLTNTLAADVPMVSTGIYYDGPSVAQGTSGKWLALAAITINAINAGAYFDVRLSDGATIIASTQVIYQGGVTPTALPVALSGVITGPVGNIRISVLSVIATSSPPQIAFNMSGNGNDSTLTVLRIG